MTSVVQIAPEISPGSGVGGVAYELEKQFRALGIATYRFTMTEARGDWLPLPGRGLRGKAGLALRVVWFSSVGTALARRYLRKLGRSDVIALCHNDALLGDIYVNHGINAASMKARGHAIARMVRNPLHIFTYARDAFRYRSAIHDVVVNLNSVEGEALAATYRRVRPRTVVIANGVDVERFAPAPPEAASAARMRLGIPLDAPCALFVGNEFDRKGLGLVAEAIVHHPDAHLLVVGGTPDMIHQFERTAHTLGIADRVHATGHLADPRAAFHAADVFVLPSAYEANALVVLEALACGVPVICTPVGYAPDLITDGENGYLIERSAPAVADAMHRLFTSPRLARARLRDAARTTALDHTWRHSAVAYQELFVSLLASRRRRGARP